MDTGTWFFRIASAILLCISLFRANGIFYNFPIVFGTLVGQGISIPRRGPFRCVFGIWILIAIVITNGYSGVLTSLMSKSIIPQFPESLEELANQIGPYQIFSFSAQPNIDEIMGTIYLEMPVPYKGTSCKHCLKIQSSTAYLLNPVLTTGRLMHFYKADSTNTPIGTSAGNLMISPNFALIESSVNWRPIQRYLKIMFPKKLLVMAGPANPFIQAYQTYSSALIPLQNCSSQYIAASSSLE